MTRFNVLSLIVIALIFSSCSKVFKVAQVESSDGLTIKDDRYVFENDTVKIIYDFWDEEGAMRYAIENKLDKPITIDWSKSHLVYRGENLPYWTNTEMVKTSGRTSSWMGAYGASFWGLGSFTSNSVIQKQEKLSHIAGKSWIWKYDYRLISIAQEKAERQIEGLENQRIPKKELKKIEKELRNDPLISSEMVNEEYEEKESPLQFRNSLELIIADSTESEKSSRVENSFYVSEMSSKPISTGINKKVYAEKSGTKIYSLRKNKNVIYPKNSVSLSIGSLNTFQSLYPEVEFGYSRLLKPFFEVGLRYGVGGEKVWGGYYTFEGVQAYHKIAASVNFIICGRRANRFSIGFFGYAQFLKNIELTSTNAMGTSTASYTNRHIYGVQVELSGRFGTPNHSFIPFITFGWGSRNLKYEHSYFDNNNILVEHSTVQYRTTDLDTHEAFWDGVALGYGIRYSFNFPK
jgi:hypothetical protein